MDRALPMARGRIIAALDIGSTKVCCFVARVDERTGLRVTGIGHQAAAGTRSGDIIDMEAVENSVLSAVHTAETMCGERIRDVYINVSCGRPRSRTMAAQIHVAGNEISSADVRRVLDECRQQANGDGRAAIHSIPIGYSVDGSNGIRDPRGMYGDRLGVDVLFVTAAAGSVRNLQTCLAGCRLNVAGQVISPYASALACLVEDEMRLGVTLVDMGGGATSIAAFADGALVYTGAVPVGGVHVTNDIAIGLNAPVSRVERIKALYGSATPGEADEQQLIDVPIVGEEDDSAFTQVPRAELVSIIRPRLEETFEMVRDRVEASDVPASARRRIVLTGGASQLQGLRELAMAMLDRPVRMGRPLKVSGLAESTGGPAFATCAGLLKYGATHGRAEPAQEVVDLGAHRNLITRMGEWLRENF